MATRYGARRGSRHGTSGFAVRLLHMMLAMGAIWFFGFLVFAGAIPGEPGDTQTRVDGIVVLTGGGERLAEGMRLLDQGMAKSLLVSGVAKGVDATALVEALEPSKRPDRGLLECCVTLGHQASSTADNAMESRDWVAAHKMRSIRLVTANYHINRSLLEFHRAMPSIEVIANPVFPPEVQDPLWFAKPRTLWLLINEYHKSAASLGRAICANVADQLTGMWNTMRQWIS